MSEKTNDLSNIEVALLDAMKAILETIIHLNPRFEGYFDRSFALQRDGKLAKGQPDAAAVFELLRRFVADPERQKAREQLATFLSEPPKGHA